ncbi:MAG: cold shock CspA family protein [Patiriisocius sp.]|jgi:cold shock CspA family protein
MTTLPTNVSVKWFNMQKGFGFFTQKDGTDVFIHISALERSGFEPSSMKVLGTAASISMVQKNSGRNECSSVHSIGGVASTSMKPRAARSRQEQKQNLAALTLGDRATGRLKFFNHTKDFGFLEVTSVVGHADVFLHITGVTDDLVDHLHDDNVFTFVVGEAEDGRLLANLQKLVQEPEMV